MSIIEALFLGVIQGLTEFLPISSSGHLMLMQGLLGMQNLRGLMLFDLVCHLGTLGALFVYFRDNIKHLFAEHGRLFFLICLGTLPLFFIVPFKSWVDKAFETPTWLWLAFLTTGIILYFGEYFGRDKGDDIRPLQAFSVGAAQAFAVIPGISRSGTTISASRIVGIPRRKAVVFSFLLAIPAILGGTVLEAAHIFFKPHAVVAANVGLLQYAVGFIFSFIAGIASLGVVMRIVLNDALKYFAWYCFAISAFCLFYFVIL
ncbi:MAG: undecaprenyl-diphosphate phosphatase [Parachlamydiales bacterium]|jgi:undecaprenyl-diphosphatase